MLSESAMTLGRNGMIENSHSINGTLAIEEKTASQSTSQPGISNKGKIILWTILYFVALSLFWVYPGA